MALSQESQALAEVNASTSQQLLSRACQSLARGDSSTMRVLPYHLPLVAERGDGARIHDADGNELIDLNMAYGPLIFGHRPKKLIDAVMCQITERGSQLGFPTEISMRVAEKIKHFLPSIELLRFANSGTEAMASAVRLARGVTGRKTIVLFEGHYHGWSDTVFHKYHAPLEDLPAAGFGPAISGSGGMNGAPHDAIVVRWGDMALLERVLDQYAGSVAAVIMEPVPGNTGVLPPDPQYLAGVREATCNHGALLIFDEVITGFRVDAGGAQEYYGVYPDITVISKALGGGYPVSAFGGSVEIMQPIVDGAVFHGGVFSGNAVVMAAAEAVLDEIDANRKAIYAQLHHVGGMLAAGLREILTRLSVPHVVQQVGAMLSLFLTREPVVRLCEYRDVRRNCDFDAYIRFQHEAQRRGVYFHPNQFEPMFLSTAHTEQEISVALERIERAAQCALAS
jgi:glutamate-1-semialdehyde 2,1-aminomutase